MLPDLDASATLKLLQTSLILSKLRYLGPGLVTMMSRNVFFTVVANNYAAYAQVLMQSVHRHHPRSHRYIIVCDEKSEWSVSSSFAELIFLEELQIHDSAAMKLRYDVMELSTV